MGITATARMTDVDDTTPARLTDVHGTAARVADVRASNRSGLFPLRTN